MLISEAALRKNLPGGLRYSDPLSLPVLWPCWKFRENSAWMKTRSIFTFPLKGVSVLSSSQAYHLPLQTHLEISLATRRRNMLKISDRVPGKASVFSDVLFQGVCKITFTIANFQKFEVRKIFLFFIFEIN